MKTYKVLRLISILAYFLIMFNGWMISMPFICVLVFSIAEFGSLFNVMAILAGIGLLLLFILPKAKTIKATLTLHIVAFLLLISPLAERLINVPLYLFNYGSFIIPCIIFLLFYILSTFFLYSDLKKTIAGQEFILDDSVG